MFHFETKQQRINRMIMRSRWNDTVMFSVMGSIRNKTKRIVLSVDDQNNTKYHNSIRRWGFKQQWTAVKDNSSDAKCLPSDERFPGRCPSSLRVSKW